MTTNEPGGVKKRRRRALLFVGGGVDTAMQLGVAHALLVSGGAPPDYVLGVSAGAVNAAAVAEVLQAGPPGLPREEQEKLSAAARLPFQVDKLRNFIETYLELPATLFDSLLPDSLEILAREPLTPLELPIHFDREREGRRVANEAKSGLVSLINDLLDIRLSVGTATRIARKILGRIAAAEQPEALKRFGKSVACEAGMLRIIWMRFPETAPLAANLLAGYLIGPNRALLHGFETAATADKLISRTAIAAKIAHPFRFTGRWLLIGHLFFFATVAWLISLLPRLIAVPFSRRDKKPGKRFAGIRAALGGIKSWFGGVLQSPLTRILRYYGLADGLANTDMLKQLLVRCFDQEYYGRTEMTKILNRSLDYDPSGAEKATDLYRKRLSDYQKNVPSIHVAAVVADVRLGELRVLPKQVPVVDALLAATAKVPFFPAVKIDEDFEMRRAKASKRYRRRRLLKERQREETWRNEQMRSEAARAGPVGELPPPRPVPPEDTEQLPEIPEDQGGGGAWYIDGANISTEAIGPLLHYVRDLLAKRKDRSASLDIYRVSSLPISSPQLPTETTFEGVLDVLPRALQLKRFRDATVEQQLTALYTKVLPRDQSYWCYEPDKKSDKKSDKKTRQVFVNARVFPLEPQRPVEILKVLLERQRVDYHELVYQTVADGCRASMEGMLPSLIRAKAQLEPVVSCAAVIEERAGGVVIPGRAASQGPGVSEICKHCALNRNADPAKTTHRASLRATPDDRADWPEWPAGAPDQLLDVIPPPPPAKKQPMDLGDWPRRRAEVEGTERPLVTLLFGGGVFRGVFHMGVMNALNQVGLVPDVVAGSSVGSIVAAMIAQVFSNPTSREREIAHLAATFMSIDKLVLTDRFADFIRRLTLRAAETKFSLRDLDLLFRRYDDENAARFNQRLRVVSAGLERLSYLSPFELLQLTRDLRLDQYATFFKTLVDDVQEFLDRYGIGGELLGAEPLALLIQNHVLSGRRAKARGRDDLFESFRDCGIFFLATATNLELGALEILGESNLASAAEPSLLYGLLASSAFPGIFRPRHSWEIFRRASEMHHYIDGGVIDNLPLDGVARFLDRASRATPRSIARRPKVKGESVPHLIFTASLEIDPGVEADVDNLVGDCLRLWKRAKTLKYNKKIDAFASTQRDIRTITKALNPPDPLLDLHVMNVKPKWLCGTFGFHPMLGFRRAKQARSIAHGCASTLATIYRTKISSPLHAKWLDAWGIRTGLDFDAESISFLDEEGTAPSQPTMESSPQLRPLGTRAPGVCWFRTGSKCPFSVPALEEAGVSKQKIEEISRIYQLCGDPATHRGLGKG